jgi:hypothetical protein
MCEPAHCDKLDVAEAPDGPVQLAQFLSGQRRPEIGVPIAHDPQHRRPVDVAKRPVAAPAALFGGKAAGAFGQESPHQPTDLPPGDAH